MKWFKLGKQILCLIPEHTNYCCGDCALIYRDRVQLQWIRLDWLLQELKKLQIEVSLFNKVFASSVFAIKVAAMGLVILCGFGAIQFSHESPLLATSNTVFALNAMLVYNILYDRGFAIPRQFTALKKLVLLKLKLKLTQGTHDTDNVRRMVKAVKSVRVMAVRVGAFHCLQRLSTPTFLDFCIKNLVRLVMGFRKLN